MPRLTKTRARKLLAELNKDERAPWDAMASLYPHQRTVFSDGSRDRVLVGTRQFGKSRLSAVEVINAGLSSPGSDVAYVDMDIDHGDKILWREVRDLLDKYQVPARVVDGSIRFENGAIGYIFSGQPSEVAKLQGLKLALLIVDEAQETTALEDILTMVRPALMRHNGRVLLLGVPGRVRSVGPWWEICEGVQAAQWSQHRGHYRDNQSLSVDAAAELIAKERERLGADSGDFLRFWEGRWPETDSELRVCHGYVPAENGYDEIPGTFALHSLGLDPGGVRDSEAVVVIGHGNDTGPLRDLIYAVDEDVSAKRQGGDWDVSGERVGTLVAKWRPQRRYYDYGSAHKDALTLIYKGDQHIRMESVPSKAPYEESQRINALFRQKRLFIKRGSKLEKDLLYASWDKDSLASGGKPKYSSSYKQDALDALRCALWGVPGWQAPAPAPPLTDQERERALIEGSIRARKAQSYGPKRDGNTGYGPRH